MNLDQALLVLEQYQQVAGVDELTAMERLVRDYRTLPVEQRLAVNVFMAAIKEPA
jgi:hypothetical protein